MMVIRVAIGGYGRIGRNILRAHYEGGKKLDLQIVAINDLGNAERRACWMRAAAASPASIPTEQTVLGAAKLVRDSKLHPAILRDEVVTPGGTTIVAMHELERHGLRAMLISAVEIATARSKEIGAQLLERFTPPAPSRRAAAAPGRKKKSSAGPRKRSRK